MADNKTIQIDFSDNSGMVLEELRAACLRALETCGLAGERFAKELVPSPGKTGTGALRSSITHQVDEGEPAVYIGTNSEYAAYVELGAGQYYPDGRPTPWVYQDAKGKWHFTHGQLLQIPRRQ
nr:HK97 gp10 family phage protein [uncultured Oscillibacter sp.]